MKTPNDLHQVYEPNRHHHTGSMGNSMTRVSMEVNPN